MDKKHNQYKIIWLLMVITLLVSPIEVGMTDAGSTELIVAGDREFLSFNYSLAYKNYSLASANNDKAGQYRLAMLLYFGYGVNKDVNKALDLLEKSSKQGYVPAQAAAGILGKYDLDEPLKTLIDHYYPWLKVSFEENNIDGMFYFALIADQKAKYYKVNGPAMSPTLNHQEIALVNLSAYTALHRPQKERYAVALVEQHLCEIQISGSTGTCRISSAWRKYCKFQFVERTGHVLRAQRHADHRKNYKSYHCIGILELPNGTVLNGKTA